MKRKEEKKHFDKLWEEMNDALRHFLENGNQKHLHQFRVQVKKLSAFLTLQPSGKSSKNFKPVKKIFKQGGNIRNVYLNIKLGQQHQVNDDAFILEQHRLMEQAINDFKLNGNKYVKAIKEIYHDVIDEIEPVANLHINLFYEKQLHQTDEDLKNNQFDDGLHRCRKLIKELLYNYKPFKPVLNISLNKDYLDDMQNAIGDWHDNMLAMQLFAANKIAIAGLNKQNTKLKRLIKKLSAEFFDKATTNVDLALEQID